MSDKRAAAMATARPTTATAGILLLFLSTVANSAAMLWAIGSAPFNPSALLAIGIALFIVVSAAQRKNWARIVLALIAGLGTLQLAATIVEGSSALFHETGSATRAVVVIALACAPFLVLVAGVILLFTPKSNAWYKWQQPQRGARPAAKG